MFMKLLFTILFAFFGLSIAAQELPTSITTDTGEIAGFKLYPNPAFDDVIYITTTENASKEIFIYDVFGKLVLHNRTSSKSIDIKGLAPGVYLIQVSEKTSSISRKLVVK